jgi:nucleotide-binding universal stress UspA family protein
VHGAPCAVAVAPARFAAGAPGQFLRVGVGFSTSKEGISALHLGQELAARAGGRLDVIAGACLEPALASYGFSSPAMPALEREIYEETKATLERATDKLGEGVPVQRETIRGDPASVLIERSSQLDILVLGSRAYGPVRHVLLGGVSARVMRQARCPVLVVPRGVGRGRRGPAEREPAAGEQRGARRATMDVVASSEQAPPGGASHSRDGVSEAEAAARLAARGPAPKPASSRSYASIVRANLLTVFNAILAAFGTITLLFGDARDALFLGIIFANVTIGITQEVRAKRALDRLASLVAPRATVLREGVPRELATAEVVPGDLVRAAGRRSGGHRRRGRGRAGPAS